MLATLSPIRKALVAGATTFLALVLAQAGIGEAPDAAAVEGAVNAVAMGVTEVFNAALGAVISGFMTWAVPNRSAE